MAVVKVTSVTSLSRSGLSDWIIQRLSAVVLAAYTLCIAGAIALNPGMDYEQWRGLFDGMAMRLFSLLALLALCAHAWVGVWTIITDYLNRPGLVWGLRLLCQAGCMLITLLYLVWGFRILW